MEFLVQQGYRTEDEETLCRLQNVTNQMRLIRFVVKTFRAREGSLLELSGELCDIADHINTNLFREYVNQVALVTTKYQDFCKWTEQVATAIETEIIMVNMINRGRWTARLARFIDKRVLELIARMNYEFESNVLFHEMRMVACRERCEAEHQAIHVAFIEENDENEEDF